METTYPITDLRPTLQARFARALQVPGRSILDAAAATAEEAIAEAARLGWGPDAMADIKAVVMDIATDAAMTAATPRG